MHGGGETGLWGFWAGDHNEVNYKEDSWKDNIKVDVKEIGCKHDITVWQ
jgi:hypothetical protein